MARGTKTYTTGKVRSIRTNTIIHTYSNVDPAGTFQTGDNIFQLQYFPDEANSPDCADTDVTPNVFVFTDVTNSEVSTVHTSNTITISGIGYGNIVAVSIAGVGGQFSKNGGAYTSVSTTAINGDTFSVRNTSSDSYSTTVNTTLTVGGVSDTYSIATRVANNVAVNYSMAWGVDPTTSHWNVIDRIRDGVTTTIATIQNIGSGTLAAGTFVEGDIIIVYQGAYIPFKWAPTSNVNLKMSRNTVQVYTGNVTTQAETQNTGSYVLSSGTTVIDIVSTGSSTAVGYITESLQVINSATQDIVRVTIVDQVEVGLGLLDLQPIGSSTSNYPFNVKGTTGLLTATIYNDSSTFSIDYTLAGEGGYTVSGTIAALGSVVHSNVTKGGLTLTIPSA